MTTKTGCSGCRNADAENFEIPFTMAFQPIVDVEAGSVWGYEALVRGKDGQGAGQVLAAVTLANRYAFDQACRVKAIELAAAGLPADSRAQLSINFMPNAVYEPRACIRATLNAAQRTAFEPTRLMFEFTENERMDDVGHVSHIVDEYKKMGFMTALDDFGAGYAGLALLAKFQTDLVKIDMELIRGIEASHSRRCIVAGIVSICNSMGIKVLAEGIETMEEAQVLRAAGIKLLQGYYFARPTVEKLVPANEIPALSGAVRAVA